MLTLLVADIFGNSAALQQLATDIADETCLIIDPYAGEMINFANEQTAYDYFNQHVGLTSYAQLLREQLATISEPFNLVAFSVGGAAVWLNGEWLSKSKVNRVSCFYASQIRHHCQLQPTVNIELILPISELHFDVKELKARLSQKSNVTIKQSQYMHGFMNPLSAHFSAPAYHTYLKRLTRQSNKGAH